MLALLPFLLFLLFTAGLWLIFYFLLPPLVALLRHGLQRSLFPLLRSRVVQQWIERRQTLVDRVMPYLPVLAILAGGVVVAMWAGDAFLDLAELLRSGNGTLKEIDQSAHQWASDYRGAATTRFFTFFTLVGTPVGLGLIVAAVTILLILKRRYRWAGYLLVTNIGGALLNAALKLHFARARPDLTLALRGAHGFSFPSGHAMGSMILFASLAYLAVHAATRWRVRSAFVALATSMILAIALSRIYLGVHWLSDIGAGLAVGSLWVVSATVAYEAFERVEGLRGLRG